MSIRSTGGSKFARKLTTRMVCERYNVCDKTIDRWVAAGILSPPMRINGIKYHDEDDLDARDRARMTAAQPDNAA